MTDSDLLQVEADGDLHIVTLNRPERLNALNQPMADALLAYFEARRRDTSVRVIILRAAGRAFCAGADLKAGGTPERLRDGPDGDWSLRDLLKAMRACPQPIICLVQGAAAGGGLAIALACDVIAAAEDTVFHPAFLKINLTGSELGVAWRLQRTMGISRAREILLTARPVAAAEALQTGLVSSVTPNANLDAHGRALAAAMLIAAPDALRLTKRALDFALEAPSVDLAMEVEERGQMLTIRAMRPK
jgi:enoyl-CoA hydratase/carnithine racemase